MAVAEELAALEAAGEFDALYERLHPDARSVVPRAAVVGWNAAEFAPRGAGWAEAVKVRFVEWVWPVTRVTYPETAAVTYRQRCAEDGLVRDAVRDGAGAWGWFFGRERAFVEEQIERFGGAP